MSYLRLWSLLIVFFIPLLPSVVCADDKYGIGGDDYIVEHEAPDLLSEDSDAAEVDYVEIYDPLEPINRMFFTFNDKLYFWVLKPVKEGYSEVIPGDIRTSIGNFFYNLASPVDFVNTLLQGRFRDSGVVIGRFLINSTLGIYGFGDVASAEFDLEPIRGDFGETLGVYGIGEGVYLCLPVFGPSNLRDSVGIVGDLQLHPYSYAGFDTRSEIFARTAEFINRLSITPDVYEEIKRISLDPYIATRSAYADYRRTLIKSHEK